MKSNIKQILIQVFLWIFLLLSINDISYAKEIDKTIIIVTNQLDFSTIEEIDFKEGISLGLMNTRTSNVFKNNKESYFMTIATGRRVELEKGLFKGIKVDNNGHMIIDGYKDIIKALDKNYKGFSNKMDFFGDTLINNNISIGYMGNDHSSLIAADKNGIIHNGYPSVEYKTDWLVQKTDSILKEKESDVLVLSYNIENDQNRVNILEEYINYFNSYNIIIFPSKVSGDMDDIRNSTLVPILYLNSNQGSGLLTSHSTERDGIITNMDIFPELAEIYDIELNTVTGYGIYSNNEQMSNKEIIDKNSNNFDKILNYIIIKYIFHGIIAIIQIYIVFDIFRRKNNNLNKYNNLMSGIIVSIFLSLLLGSFDLGWSIILYCVILIVLTRLIISYTNSKNANSIVFFSICTNILLLVGVFFKPDIIYHSFFGFNNIVSGGRFYGLNNETMGILLATSIITYFWAKEFLNSKIASLLILIIYFPINIIALSGSYASNFGGFSASLVLFAMLIYLTIFNNKFSAKNLFSLVAIGIAVFILTLIIELNSPISGHAETFFSRVSVLGMQEFIDMIFKKAKQLTLTAISPPWSIVLIGQIYFIMKFKINGNTLITKYGNENSNLTRQLLIIFISSIIVFLINDTGAIAFVYMNTYVLAKLINIHLRHS